MPADAEEADPEWLRKMNEHFAARWKEREEQLARWSHLGLAELMLLPEEEVVDALNLEALRRAEPELAKLSATKDLMPRGLFVVMSCLALDAEVKNGGFYQFFENQVLHADDPAFAVDVLQCMREVGANAHARLLALAQAVIPLLHVCTDDGSDEVVEDDVFRYFDAGVELLDDTFFELPDLEGFLCRFVRTQPEAFLG